MRVWYHCLIKPAIYRMEAEIAEIKTRWEHYVTEMSRDSVTRDVHLNALREAEEGLKDELVRRKQDIER